MAHRKTIDEYDVNSDDQMIYNTSITVDAGLTVNSLSVNQNGTLYITDGATANKTTVNENGTILVYNGGTANDTSINALGEAIIENGGSANNTAMNGGTLLVNSGGIADKTTLSGVWSDFEGMKLLDTAQMTISAGGIAKNTTVNQWSYLDIEYGGSAKNVTVALGGEVYISEGGTLSGKLNISNGTVQADNGAFIDFTVADHQVDGDYLINDLSLIKGTPVYTITVNNNQKDGIYKLAQGAGNFIGTVSIGTDGNNYGTLTANSTALQYNGISYSLIRESGNLLLSVSKNSAISLLGDKNGVSFTGFSASKYVVEFSKNNFAGTLYFDVAGNAVDTYNLPAGTYQWQITVDETSYQGDDIISDNTNAVQEIISDEDCTMDVFFVNTDGVWTSNYASEHIGILNGWNGTGERVNLCGKNKIADIFIGSSDANILVMTDDANGDALFADDIYTALPETVTEQQSRIAHIDEIRAGFGDDIIDMTSQRFACIGDGIKICGGLGNDTIWANNGSNTLFGDAGNDRIVGGSGNDIIVGGIGNDSMHGGGGNDIFTFGDNWGNDTIEQLDGGKITLWFESGSESSWNASTLTYSDGANSVTITGTTQIELFFGGSAPVEGAFADAASEKIFNEKSKGMLA